jgi:hypothetical protein
MTTNLIYSDISNTSSIGLDASERALRFVLTALSEGRVLAVEQNPKTKAGFA